MRTSLGAVLTGVAMILVLVGAVLLYGASEDAESERGYQACLEREREAYDNGDRLVTPEDYCDTMFDR